MIGILLFGESGGTDGEGGGVKGVAGGYGCVVDLGYEVFVELPKLIGEVHTVTQYITTQACCQATNVVIVTKYTQP